MESLDFVGGFWDLNTPSSSLHYCCPSLSRMIKSGQAAAEKKKPAGAIGSASAPLWDWDASHPGKKGGAPSLMLHAPPPPGAVLFRPSATASTPRHHLVKRIPDLSDALSHGTTSSACLHSQALHTIRAEGVKLAA